MTRTRHLLLALLALLALVAAACGADEDADAESSTETTAADAGDESDEVTTDDTEAESTDDTEPAEDEGEEVDVSALDFNGDGEVAIGFATPGPRDDGAYYQALVEGIMGIAAEYGLPEPIVVDEVAAADAATELENLAAQNVDMIIVGASEIAEPMPELAEQYSDIYWYCNCGAGYTESEFYAQSQDDGSEINYTAGYATGLLLQESGDTGVTFLGCCNLPFETESLLAFEAGLQAVDESYTIDYVPTGDFNDVAAATEAFNQALAGGTGAIYPFLGGAHEPIVQLANENGLITMSAGSSAACERDDLDYQIAVRFDGGDYIRASFEEIITGEFAEGDIRVFHVGVDAEPGAEICDATPEQQEAMDAVYEQIAAGELGDLFGQINGEAYGG